MPALRQAILVGGVLLLPTVAAGADAPSDVVIAPASGGSPVVAARVLGGQLAYRACAQVPCVPSADAAIALPLGTPPESVHIEPLAIGASRHVLWAHTPSWSALVGAGTGPSLEARVLWSGSTGWAEGEEGERHGGWIEVTEPDADGVVKVLVGEVREDVSICGRPSILSPRLLDRRDLTFKAATVQRLRRDERDRAIKLEAAIAPPGPHAGESSIRILQATAASSGSGSPAALTDGDLETSWSEKRGGPGPGEFVRMNAPEQVDITSISFVVRPPTKPVPKGAGPRQIWLATPDALFAVAFREDPWTRPGASYTVKFPEPIRTQCLSIVLDEAYVKGPSTDVDVTLAEVTAHTEFDAKPDPLALAGALAGGQARARMAAALLTRGGDAAQAAAAQAYPTLDDAGRLLALEVIDGAPCAQSAPIYLKAMQIGRPGEVHHAADRLLRCGRDAASALSTALASGSDKTKVDAAKLLSLVAPDLAVENILETLPEVRADVRSELRAALSRASQRPAGRKAVAAELSGGSLSPVASIDLLRAAASEPIDMPEARAALARLLTDHADFRTRYLLLAPAAALAQGGDAQAQAFVLRSLGGDTDVHVRTRAAEVAGELPAAVSPLAAALGDDDPRVRDAALTSIARLTDPQGQKVQTQAWPGSLFDSVAKLLEKDPWSFVRVHAAESLRGAPAGEPGDGPLARALADESPAVRGRAIDTLGARSAKAHAAEILARLDDEAEVPDVRARAARALGRVCAAQSVDHLTELAHRASVPGADPTSQMLGASAAAALARLNPPDLAKRLGPLTDARAPRLAREMGKAALSATEHCPKSAE